MAEEIHTSEFECEIEYDTMSEEECQAVATMLTSMKDMIEEYSKKFQRKVRMGDILVNYGYSGAGAYLLQGNRE